MTYVRDLDYIRWTDEDGTEREAIVYDDDAGRVTIDEDATAPENVERLRAILAAEAPNPSP